MNMDRITRNSTFRKLILVAEDEIVNMMILGNILEQYEYDVIYAQNGIEAMKQIRDHRQILSMILLDLNMPKMSGYDVLRALKEDEDLSRIPTIVLTSENEAEVESLELGAVDFIPKPYSDGKVIAARVRRNIELAEDKQIIQNTQRDSVTGLYTREFFFQYVRQWDLYHRDMVMDCVVMNISHFHMINEVYGHETGDALLKLIGARIYENLELNGGIGCRSEADNFLLYIPRKADYRAAIREFSEMLNRQSPVSNVRLRIGIHPGVDETAGYARCFDKAARACMSIRNDYSVSTAWYDEQMHEKEIYSERLINDLDEAIESGQFKVCFQPKFDITREKPKLCSAEALIRWEHPELGYISPNTFIPLFENNGQIRKLDYFVWTKTARHISEWKKRYGTSVPVSVNVSRVDMFNPDLEKDLMSILHAWSLQPEDLILEVTESAYTDDSGRIIRIVENLRNAGFRIEMDDFGSGYSSLNMLTQLPVDALKMDKEFVRNMTKSMKDMKMVELMIDIGGFLSVPVVAEGVETQEQFDRLRKCGCDIIQGYYFSRPVTADGFERFLEEG